MLARAIQIVPTATIARRKRARIAPTEITANMARCAKRWRGGAGSEAMRQNGGMKRQQHDLTP